MSRRWQPEEEALLRELYEAQGLSAKEAAASFPMKTPTAVGVKIKRMKLRHTKEQKSAALSRSVSGPLNGMYGKAGPRRGVVLTEATKAKISKTAQQGFATGRRQRPVGSKNPMFGKPSPMRGRTLPTSARETLSIKASERWERRSRAYKDAHILKMRKGWAAWAASTAPTWIEALVSTWLADAGHIVREQVPIGFYVVDFLVGRVVVETHGDYWHGNPAVYQGELDKVQKAAVRRDKAKRTYLTNRGYTVLEIWEKDLRETPDLCRGYLLGVLA